MKLGDIYIYITAIHRHIRYRCIDIHIQMCIMHMPCVCVSVCIYYIYIIRILFDPAILMLEINSIDIPYCWSLHYCIGQNKKPFTFFHCFSPFNPPFSFSHTHTHTHTHIPQPCGTLVRIIEDYYLGQYSSQAPWLETSASCAM